MPEDLFLIPIGRIIVFDPKTKTLYGNEELHFTQNGDMIQITIGGRLSSNPHSVTRNPHTKKRRKTAYQSAYSAAYKRLKKKHPRMAFGSLSKKAHAAARKKVK